MMRDPETTPELDRRAIDTADLADDLARRMLARRRRVPLWARIAHAIADLATSLGLPIVTSVGTWVTGQSTGLAAWCTAAAAIVAGVRLWFTRSPIFRDHGLAAFDDEEGR
jgi:hypothetical protein